MKTTIALILSLLSTPVLAQYYPVPVPAPIYQAAPPTTYQTYGNRTYGSDGSTATTYGNQTYIQPANPSQPQTVCSTYGTITTCQ